MTAAIRAASNRLTPARRPISSSPGPRPGGPHALSASRPRPADGPGGAHLRQRRAAADATSCPAPARPASTAWNHDWARGAVFYEIFVRSFQDSDGDGIGDLKGLISRLDYLNDGDPRRRRDLGVDALWLMPVFESPELPRLRHHRLREHRPRLWHERRLPTLLDEAHRRGIRVIVDLVMNHSGSGHPWFVSAASSPSSPHRDWYVWSATTRAGSSPGAATAAPGTPANGALLLRRLLGRHARPELATPRPARGDEAARRPLARPRRRRVPPRRDALPRRDGRRRRAGRHARDPRGPEGVRRARPARQARARSSSARTGPTRRSSRPTTARPPRSPGGDELPMNFNFPLADRILQAVGHGRRRADRRQARRGAEGRTRRAPSTRRSSPTTTRSRLATQLGRNQGRLRNAAAILLTLPGAPFLYYGEEVGIQNGPTGGRRVEAHADAVGRHAGRGLHDRHAVVPVRARAARPPTSPSQTDDPASLLSRYRALIRARKASEALRRETSSSSRPLTGPRPRSPSCASRPARRCSSSTTSRTASSRRGRSR